MALASVFFREDIMARASVFSQDDKMALASVFFPGKIGMFPGKIGIVLREKQEDKSEKRKKSGIKSDFF